MKARWKMGEREYTGILETHNFWDDEPQDDNFLWVFKPDMPGIRPVNCNVLFTREAALEDARAHGIEIID